MTRVIHTGDTHIGYQQYNSPERRRDFLDAFGRVAEDAVDADVDAVVHAGDLFHDRRPGLVDLQGTVDVLRTLADAGVPFLAVVGNHERKRDAQWLDLFADLGLATRLGREPVVIGDAAFYGLDFVPRSRRPDLSYEFEPVPPEADHAALVGHGLFEPFAHADWDTETVLEESTVDFDVVLLGDNHTPDTAEVAGTWVTYCGSTERASAAEREARGYNVVRFDDEVSISRRSIDGTREFVFVDVELEEGEGLDRVRERVREYDLDDAVTVITVDGEGEALTPAAVEEFALERGALVARAADRREAEVEAEVTVQFADPDDAVRERVRELALSGAAGDIDRVVRDTEHVADANVRERVERRVREALETDRSAFEPGTTEDEEDAPEGDDATDATPDGATRVDDGTETGTDDGAERADAPDDPDGDGPAPEDADAAESDADDAESAADASPDDEDSPSDDGGSERRNADGQVSIGDFS